MANTVAIVTENIKAVTATVSTAITAHITVMATVTKAEVTATVMADTVTATVRKTTTHHTDMTVHRMTPVKTKDKPIIGKGQIYDYR